MRLFDTHAHIDLPRFGNPEEQRFAAIRARQAGIVAILVPAIEPATWPSLQSAVHALAASVEAVRFHTALGVHPQVVGDLPPDDDESLPERLAAALDADPGVVAIGECGLDFGREFVRDEAREREDARAGGRAGADPRAGGRAGVARAGGRAGADPRAGGRAGADPRAGGRAGVDPRAGGRAGADPRARQLAILDVHLALARRRGLPLLLHCLHAHEALVERLEAAPTPPSILHSFSGSAEIAARLCRAGHFISFAGALTNPRARKPARAAAAVPLDRLLVETDSPDQTPLRRRPAANEPAFLVDVVEALAAARGARAEAIAEATTANACRVLGVPPP